MGVVPNMDSRFAINSSGLNICLFLSMSDVLISLFEFLLKAGWFVQLVSLLCLYGLAHTIINLPLRILIRWTRHKNIMEHGWPKNSLMDGDGDIIHPSNN